MVCGDRGEVDGSTPAKQEGSKRVFGFKPATPERSRITCDEDIYKQLEPAIKARLTFTQLRVFFRHPRSTENMSPTTQPPWLSLFVLGPALLGFTGEYKISPLNLMSSQICMQWLEFSVLVSYHSIVFTSLSAESDIATSMLTGWQNLPNQSINQSINPSILSGEQGLPRVNRL